MSFDIGSRDLRCNLSLRRSAAAAIALPCFPKMVVHLACPTNVAVGQAYPGGLSSRARFWCGGLISGFSGRERSSGDRNFGTRCFGEMFRLGVDQED